MLNTSKFIETALQFASDDELRQKLSTNTLNFINQLNAAKTQYSNIELARDRGTFIRKKTIEALDKYLLRFESNMMKNGGKVIWGVDADSANEQILEILNQHGINEIVKAPSALATEIGLTDTLKNKGINIVTTGLAEEVLQRKGDKKAHVSHPTLRYNKADMADALGLETDIPNESMLDDQRERHHNRFKKLTASITEATFLVAENGNAVFSENEGNAYLASSMADIQIILAGIETVTASKNDLDVFLPLYSTYQSGQILNNYNFMLGGPHGKKDMDGPKEVYVVLVDNGRSDVLAMVEQRDALCSLNTGSSALVDPVFKTVSGLGYSTLNPGPIGAIIEPFKTGVKEQMHLSYVSTLSAHAAKNSPIKIDINGLLIKNRNYFVTNGLVKDQGKTWSYWKKVMLNRKKLDKRKSMKKFYLNLFFKKQWGNSRVFPELAEKSFNQLWQEQRETSA